MATPFLSSEEYDERAHQLYNEGNYDDALETLREGLGPVPQRPELHVGVGYARVARDEYAWARRSFEEALVLDPDHEDALAGLGETLLKFGQSSGALKSFHRILELGYQDDIDLMLQVGRALFRDGLMEEAKEYFDTAVQQVPDNAEAVAMASATRSTAWATTTPRSRRCAARCSSIHEYVEARIYLGNVLYDRGEYEAALYHLDRTSPDDHWDELGIWRLIELKKSTTASRTTIPRCEPWDARLNELAGSPTRSTRCSAKSSGGERRRGRCRQGAARALRRAAHQSCPTPMYDRAEHTILLSDGSEYIGTWERIVHDMREASYHLAGRSLKEYMANEARRGYSLTGVKIPTSDAESFIRGSEHAGLLRIRR